MTIDETIVLLNSLSGKDLQFKQHHGSSHGIERCILTDNSGNHFIFKYTASPDQRKREMLQREAESLLYFNEIRVRTPIVFSHKQLPGFIMSYIRNTRFGNSDLAELLVRLHSHSATQYGLDKDNYLATIKLDNNRRTSWAEFYWFNRVLPLLKIASENNDLPLEMIKEESRFINSIDTKVPHEKPVLIHGDLWAGNFLIDDKSMAWLIDPASYYGHREMDIAMSKLFGGFSTGFYSEYNELMPLEPGWEERIPLFQFYYLLAHVILFGHTYSSQTIAAWNEILRCDLRKLKIIWQ